MKRIISVLILAASTLFWSVSSPASEKNCSTAAEGPWQDTIRDYAGQYVSSNGRHQLQIQLTDLGEVFYTGFVEMGAIEWNLYWKGKVGDHWKTRGEFTSSKDWFTGSTTNEWRREVGNVTFEDNKLTVVRAYESKAWYQIGEKSYKEYKEIVNSIEFLPNGEIAVIVYDTSTLREEARRYILHK